MVIGKSHKPFLSTKRSALQLIPITKEVNKKHKQQDSLTLFEMYIAD